MRKPPQINKAVNKAGLPVYFLAEQPKVKSPKEDAEACNYFAHAKYKFKDLGRLFFHVANESKSAVQYRKKLAQMGVTSGVSDYILLKARGGYHFAVIELKRSRKADSSISAEQKEFLLEAKAEGGFVAVCYGFQAALYALEEYLSL